MDQDPTQPFEPDAEPGVPAQPPVEAQQADAQPTDPHPASDAAAAQPTPPPAPAEPSPWARPAVPAPAASTQAPLPPPASPWSAAPAPEAQPPAAPGQFGAAPAPAQPYAPPAQPYAAPAPAQPYAAPAQQYGAPAPGQPTQQYGAPAPGQPAQQYGAPSQPYGAATSYGAPVQPTVGFAGAPGVPGAPGGTIPPTGFAVPVAPIGDRPRRRNPLRYVVALLIVALVVAGGLGATLLLTGSSGGASALAGYAPADTLLYAEGRLDLPGNQRAEVAKTLAALPGFADQAALSTKLGEVFDRIVKAATKDKHDYQTQIAPWFGGQIAVAEGPQGGFGGFTSFSGMSPAPSPTISPAASLPPCSGGETATPSPSPSDEGMGSYYGSMSMSIRTLVLANVTDAKKAEAWVNSILADASVKTTDRTCDGVVVHIVGSSSSYIQMPDMGWAILADKVLVAGDIDSLRLAIATKGSAGLSTVANFQKAMSSLRGDHVGLLYEAVQAMIKAQAAGMATLSGSTSGDSAEALGAMTAAYGVMADLMPEGIAGDLKASNGNIVLDTVQPKKDYQAGDNRTSDLAALAPAKTIALLDTHDLGKMLGSIKDKFAADPKLDKYVKQLDSALNLAGGFSGTVGWIGDAGFAVTRDGSKVSGGVLIRPQDVGAAQRLVSQLRAFVELTGGSSGLSFKDEDYKGVKITSVDLSALAPLLESSMGSSGMSVPSDLQLAYVVTDKVVVLTLDTSFAKSVIDASQGGDSLAKDARFSALLDQAGTKNAGLSWLDITATRELVEGILPSDAKTKYEADIKPYVVPFDAIATANVVDGDLLRGTMIVSLKH